MIWRGKTVKFGFMWSCPWRVQWKHRFEYWDRSQLGPFYALHYRDRVVDTRSVI